MVGWQNIHLFTNKTFICVFFSLKSYTLHWQPSGLSYSFCSFYSLPKKSLGSSKITSARWFKLADRIFTERKTPVTKMHWTESASFPFDRGFIFIFLLRPYHTLLFLVDEGYLVASLPGDCSPAVTRLVRMASPLKRYTANVQLE